MGSGLVPELTPKMCTREMRFFLKKQTQKNFWCKKSKKKIGPKSWIATTPNHCRAFGCRCAPIDPGTPIFLVRFL